MRKSQLIPFFFMFLVYLLTMGLYYNQTHNIVIDEIEKNIEDILLSQRALANLVSDIQKPEVYKLKTDGTLDKDYFSPALLSSSFITIKLNDLANLERKKLGIAPLLYKYASPNPTNLKNLADIYDMNVYQRLQDKSIAKFKETITEDGKTYLYYAIAGQTITQKCLHCHGDPSNAPKSLIKQYGDENGFGYKLGELSSIISIKAPLDGIYKENDKKFFFISFIVFLIFVSLFILASKLQSRLEQKEGLIRKAHLKQKEITQKSKALETSIENLYDHVIFSQFDMQGKLIEASDALSRLCGYSREELIGNSFCFFRHPDTSNNLLQEIWKSLLEDKTWKGEVKNLTKDGKVFWIEANISPIKDENNITYAFEAIMRTITENKALLEDINVDPLTGLLNRRSFEKCFEIEKDRAKRDKKYFSLLMIDIDFFKQYNDYYGHQKGDKILQAVAKSLQNSFRRSSDFIFRLGGEEFAIFTSEHSVSQIIDSATNACNKLHREHIQHIKSDVDPFLTISIGVAVVDYDTPLTLEDIYEKSDKALYLAKKAGRNRVEYIKL